VEKIGMSPPVSRIDPRFAAGAVMWVYRDSINVYAAKEKVISNVLSWSGRSWDCGSHGRTRIAWALRQN
jgi:hypothetical protein